MVKCKVPSSHFSNVLLIHLIQEDLCFYTKSYVNWNKKDLDQRAELINLAIILNIFPPFCYFHVSMFNKKQRFAAKKRQPTHYSCVCMWLESLAMRSSTFKRAFFSKSSRPFGVKDSWCFLFDKYLLLSYHPDMTLSTKMMLETASTSVVKDKDLYAVILCFYSVSTVWQKLK